MITVEVTNDDGEIVELEINADESVDVFDYDIEVDIIAHEFGERSNVLAAIKGIQRSPLLFLAVMCERPGKRCWGVILCEWAINMLTGAQKKPKYNKYYNDLINESKKHVMIAKRYYLETNIYKNKKLFYKLKKIDHPVCKYIPEIEEFLDVVFLSRNAVDMTRAYDKKTQKELIIDSVKRIERGFDAEIASTNPLLAINKQQGTGLCEAFYYKGGQ